MLNLNYLTLATAYRRYAALAPAALLEALGWARYADTPAYARNGAVLTSLALLSAGVPLNGPLRIEAGPLVGRKVQNGANRLADWLGAHHQPPEMLPLDNGLGGITEQLFGRRGIVAFIQGSGPAGGAVALLDGHNAAAACIAAQPKHPLEVRFWEIF
ncbi:MAG: hypothetical protein HYU74_11680 [Dechloromonas sp.]|nr:hypothetical protein [Dechloromonas sp.]